MHIYANTCSYVNIKRFSKSWNIMKHFTILHISSHEILYSIDLLLSSANTCRTPAASCSSSTSLSTIFREVSKLAGQRCSGVYSCDSCGDVPSTCANGIKVKPLVHESPVDPLVSTDESLHDSWQKNAKLYAVILHVSPYIRICLFMCQHVIIGKKLVWTSFLMTSYDLWTDAAAVLGRIGEDPVSRKKLQVSTSARKGIAWYSDKSKM